MMSNAIAAGKVGTARFRRRKPGPESGDRCRAFFGLRLRFGGHLSLLFLRRSFAGRADTLLLQQFLRERPVRRGPEPARLVLHDGFTMTRRLAQPDGPRNDHLKDNV